MKNTTNLINRTKQFWEWFSANEKKLSEILANPGNENSHEAAIAFISEGVALLSEELNFNIGGDHEFTFTIEGNSALFYLLPYVTANLPEKFRGKWKFFPGMQGDISAGMKFRMFGADVDVEKVMAGAVKDEEGKSADLRFYSEELASLGEEERYTVFCILLDLCVGEALAYFCVDKVESADTAEEDMIPLTELKQWMLDNLCEDGAVPDVTDRYLIYEMEPGGEDPLLREDTIILTSCCPRILTDYYDNKNDMYQIFEEFGAKPVFLFYYCDWGDDESREETLAERNAMTDMLEEKVLGKRGNGQEIGMVLGAATGTDRMYIDLLLYDEEAFIKKARKMFAKSPHMIFCKEFCQEGREYLITDDSVPGFADRFDILSEIYAYDGVIRTVDLLPAEKQDFDMLIIYARALNNSRKPQNLLKSLEILDGIRKKGEKDAIWNWRYGYALYYTGRIEESVPYLQKAIKLGDDHPETAHLLQCALTGEVPEWDAEALEDPFPEDSDMVPDIGRKSVIK